MLGFRLRSAALLISLAIGSVLTTSAAFAGAAKTSRHAHDDSDEPKEKTHVVAPGQTLAKIAKRYHVSVEDLREANDIRPGERLHQGTRLTIPSPDEDHARAKKKSSAKDVPASYERDADRDRETDRDEDSRGTKNKSHKKSDRDDAERDSGDDDSRSSKKKSHNKKSDRDDVESRSGATDRLGHRGEGVVKPGSVRLVRGSEVWEGKLLDKKHKLAERTLEGFTRMLAPNAGNKRHSIDPRLITLVGMVSDHFHGRPLEVVSGFRPVSPTQYTPHSRHNGGFAIDFHVRGISNEDLRDYCKTFREVGVGFYPNSSFVHLDVRETSTSWVDESKPGEAPRYHRPESAKDADETTGDVLGESTETTPAAKPTADPPESKETPDAVAAKPKKEDKPTDRPELTPSSPKDQ